MDLAEGDEEAQLAAMLAALESRASRDIAQLATSSLENQAAFNAQSAAIRDGLAAVRAAMRELEALTEEQDTEEQSARLADVLRQHHTEYDLLQAAFKQANVDARRNTEAAAAAARKALLAGPTAGHIPGRPAPGGAVATSQGITQSLQRTRQLMAQELEHTSATLAALDTSNERLGEARDELQTQRGLFKGSRRLLRALVTSAMLDNLSLYGGLALFFAVVAYILQKRTLYFAPLHRLVKPLLRAAAPVGRALKPVGQAVRPAGRTMGKVIRPVAVAAWDATKSASIAVAAVAADPKTWVAVRRQLSRLATGLNTGISNLRGSSGRGRGSTTSQPRTLVAPHATPDAGEGDEDAAHPAVAQQLQDERERQAAEAEALKADGEAAKAAERAAKDAAERVLAQKRRAAEVATAEGLEADTQQEAQLLDLARLDANRQALLEQAGKAQRPRSRQNRQDRQSRQKKRRGADASEGPGADQLLPGDEGQEGPPLLEHPGGDPSQAPSDEADSTAESSTQKQQQEQQRKPPVEGDVVEQIDLPLGRKPAVSDSADPADDVSSQKASNKPANTRTSATTDPKQSAVPEFSGVSGALSAEEPASDPVPSKAEDAAQTNMDEPKQPQMVSGTAANETRGRNQGAPSSQGSAEQPVASLISDLKAAGKTSSAEPSSRSASTADDAGKVQITALNEQSADSSRAAAKNAAGDKQTTTLPDDELQDGTPASAAADVADKPLSTQTAEGVDTAADGKAADDAASGAAADAASDTDVVVEAAVKQSDTPTGDAAHEESSADVKKQANHSRAKGTLAADAAKQVENHSREVPQPTTSTYADGISLMEKGPIEGQTSASEPVTDPELEQEYELYEEYEAAASIPQDTAASELTAATTERDAAASREREVEGGNNPQQQANPADAASKTDGAVLEGDTATTASAADTSAAVPSGADAEYGSSANANLAATAKPSGGANVGSATQRDVNRNESEEPGSAEKQQDLADDRRQEAGLTDATNIDSAKGDAPAAERAEPAQGHPPEVSGAPLTADAPLTHQRQDVPEEQQQQQQLPNVAESDQSHTEAASQPVDPVKSAAADTQQQQLADADDAVQQHTMPTPAQEGATSDPQQAQWVTSEPVSSIGQYSGSESSQADEKLGGQQEPPSQQHAQEAVAQETVPVASQDQNQAQQHEELRTDVAAVNTDEQAAAQQGEAQPASTDGPGPQRVNDDGQAADDGKYEWRWHHGLQVYQLFLTGTDTMVYQAPPDQVQAATQSQGDAQADAVEAADAPESQSTQTEQPQGTQADAGATAAAAGHTHGVQTAQQHTTDAAQQQAARATTAESSGTDTASQNEVRDEL